MYQLYFAPGAASFAVHWLLRWSRNMPRPATEWPTCRTRYERDGLAEWA